jgi:hypothetical protein
MMVQLFNVLAADVPWTDWKIPWAGIGALLAGTGSLFTGIAALKSARRRGSYEATDKIGDSPSD